MRLKAAEARERARRGFAEDGKYKVPRSRQPFVACVRYSIARAYDRK